MAGALGLPHTAEEANSRGARPAVSGLWLADGALRPEAWQAFATVRGAGADNLDPETYGASRLGALLARASSGDRQALMEADSRLSQAFARYVVDLHKPAPQAALIRTAPEVQPSLTTEPAVLERLRRAPSLAAGVAEARRMHPVYADLRRSLAQYRRERVGPIQMERLIIANLERARALPADPGRHLLVDVAAQRLWLFDGGRPVDHMRVVVGRPDRQTPAMSGLVRYALFDPYWNVPVDLVRDDLAPKVLLQGPEVLTAQRLEVLSDWSAQARAVEPDAIDWNAVAAGTIKVRVRQRPGRDNMMGQVKFMLPNDLGVYLHDTPVRSSFAAAPRVFSSGCVRVEDARKLARWLFGDGFVWPAGEPDRRIELPRPIPVYMIYLTAAPAEQGLSFRPDIYDRDRRIAAAPASGRVRG